MRGLGVAIANRVQKVHSFGRRTWWELGVWNVPSLFMCGFANMVDGFWGFCFLAVLWAKNGQNWQPYWIFGHFLNMELSGSGIFGVCRPDMGNCMWGRCSPDFRFLACMLSSVRVGVPFVLCWWSRFWVFAHRVIAGGPWFSGGRGSSWEQFFLVWSTASFSAQ